MSGALPAPEAGLSGVAARYEAFLIDQFGVFHDGTRAYPGAVEAVERLKAAGKRILFLTNSGRPADYNEARIARMGLARAHYDGCVTSGDVAARLCETGAVPLPQGRQLRCLTVSSPGDFNLSDRLGAERTERGEDADLVILAGSQADRIPMDRYAALLRPAAARGVPAICTNPDRMMLTPTGLAPSAGAIADLYAEMGGPVRFVGKPHAEVYDEAVRRFGGIARERILCIGDSPDHDIAGAQSAGLPRMLVRTGILADMSEAALAADLAEKGLRVDHQIGSLVW